MATWYIWEMGDVRLSRRSYGTRLMAGVLLMGFLLLTAGPVCGSPSDVDPMACCKHHGCHRSGLIPRIADTLRHSLQVSAGNDESSPTGNSPEDCCRRGDMTYPVAEVQASVSMAPLALNVLAVVSAPAFNLSVIGNTFVCAADTSPPLKLLFIAPYTLQSAYRI